MTLPGDFYEKLFNEASLELGFNEERLADFGQWSEQLRTELRELLGVPAEGPPAPDVEVVSKEDCRDFVREKIVIKNGLVDEIPAYLLLPIGPEGPVPGIMCLHGHGGYFAGKDMVAGITNTDPISIECAEALNYGYGVQLAKAGYATLCPDAFNFGERMLEKDRWSKEHVCYDYFVGLVNYGLSPIGVTTVGHMQGIDYLLSRPEVGGDTVGCVGLSFGGSQTLILTCADTRVSAAVISGALSSYSRSPSARCGAQVMPGMLKWFDQTDMVKAIAPRPILCEIMTADTSFNYETSMELYKEIRAVYEAIGAGDKISLDTADTDHRYIGNKVEEFFNEHLPIYNL